MSLTQYNIENRVAYISINRPEKRNALNQEVVVELTDLFSRGEADPNVKVVVLKGEGSAFCAGADLEYLQKLQQNNFEENLTDSTILMELYKKIYLLKKVVIAQVNGHAIAGGAGLVSVCDFAFSVTEANFGYTEVKIGFIPAIVMVFLIKKIGEGKARELLLSGNIINGEEAAKIGLINRVVEEDKLESTVNEFAQKLIRSNSGLSLEYTKKMINEVQSLSLHNALEFACKKNAEVRSSEDCKKGIDSFLNKKKLEW